MLRFAASVCDMWFILEFGCWDETGIQVHTRFVIGLEILEYMHPLISNWLTTYHDDKLNLKMRLNFVIQYQYKTAHICYKVGTSCVLSFLYLFISHNDAWKRLVLVQGTGKSTDVGTRSWLKSIPVCTF